MVPLQGVCLDFRLRVSARKRQEASLGARQERVERRLESLGDGFAGWVRRFDAELPFGPPEQHVRTLTLRASWDSPSAAVRDRAFVESLWATLDAWDMNTRAARLAPVGDFSLVLASASPVLDQLTNLRLDDEDLDFGEALPLMWGAVEAVSGITLTKAKLVATTKALHHILPDLFVPFDRQYTATFFEWYGNEIQNAQKRVFERTYEAFRTLAISVNPRQYVGEGWRTSAAKILDNAIVAFMRDERSSPAAVFDLPEVQATLSEFADARDWAQFHSPKNLSMALAAETGELLEIFQWLTEEQSQALSTEDLAHARDELADVQIYVARLADLLGIDLDDAVREKMSDNERRYPADVVRGTATKYSKRLEGESDS
jgi:NTP pyrophosphatase (non-canonical NTP hydrolase)